MVYGGIPYNLNIPVTTNALLPASISLLILKNSSFYFPVRVISILFVNGKSLFPAITIPLLIHIFLAVILDKARLASNLRIPNISRVLNDAVSISRTRTHSDGIFTFYPSTGTIPFGH